MHDEARDWLLLLTSGRATVADAKALQAWRAQSPEHAQAFEQTKALWQQLAPALEHAAPPRSFGRRAFLGGAIAASAAVVMVRVGTPGGFAGLTADYRTEVGEQRQVLPQRLGLLECLGMFRALGAPGLQGFGVSHGGAARRQQEQPVAGFIVQRTGGGCPQKD